MRRSRRRARQHELRFRTWGGVRRGAGRKPKRPRTGVSHRARPALSAHDPVHVTVRLRAGLPSLRRDSSRAAIERAFSGGAQRFGFRLTQYSIQSNHVHVIAEANDRRALARGMQGLLVRVARSLNRLWARKGSVFSDRYHARQLRTPREVHAALCYVLHNARHHGLRLSGVDTYSSGPWFDGWTRELEVLRAFPRALERLRAFPGALARTWLLRVGWRRHGLIGLEECPRRPQSGVRALLTASGSTRKDLAAARTLEASPSDRGEECPGAVRAEPLTSRPTSPRSRAVR